jgi:hypothetical protein
MVNGSLLYEQPNALKPKEASLHREASFAIIILYAYIISTRF